MDRVAVFVDAGYLFAQGSAAIAGSKRRRTELVLDASAAVAQLAQFAVLKAPECRLLRVYWYDGAISGTRPTTDQAVLANLDHVKLRLGFVNSLGQQKGVDSLIVTDLIELARQKSISDALLVSGDEDVRVGVQIAQNYGVKVHLLGIVPSRGSQSPQLLQEADTTAEWSADTIKKFLSLRAAHEPSSVDADTPTKAENTHARTTDLDELENTLNAAVADFVAALEQSDIDGLLAYWKTERGVPPDFDKQLLPRGRDAIGRNLEQSEKRIVRSAFQTLVRQRAGG